MVAGRSSPPEGLETYVPCAHVSRTPVFSNASNGVRMWRLQCDQCGGGMLGLKKTDPLCAKAIPKREHPVELQWREREAELARKRQVEQDEWWGRSRAYLKSPEWIKRRRLVIERENGLCEGCRLQPGAHVHHKTYARFGQELLIDLALLCEDCHAIVHPHRFQERHR